MFGKCRYLDEITGGRGVVFATGTPVSNSMTELYTVMRYLQYSTLQQKKLTHFDCWASTFGETTTAIELAQSREFLNPRQRLDPERRTVHIPAPLGLITGNTTVAVQIPMLQTVCFEGRIRKPKINVPVIFIARILSQPAGVQRQEESRKQNSKTYFSDERIHFQRSFSISGRPESFVSAGGAVSSTFPPSFAPARVEPRSSEPNVIQAPNTPDLE